MNYFIIEPERGDYEDKITQKVKGTVLNSQLDVVETFDHIYDEDGNFLDEVINITRSYGLRMTAIGFDRDIYFGDYHKAVRDIRTQMNTIDDTDNGAAKTFQKLWTNWM